MSKKPDESLLVWNILLGGAAVLLAVMLVLSVRSSLMAMKGPPSPAPVVEIQPEPQPPPAAVVVLPEPEQAQTAVPAAVQAVEQPHTNIVFNLPVVEMDRLLERQVEDLERERRENAGTDNPMVLTEEQIRKLKESRNVIF